MRGGGVGHVGWRCSGYWGRQREGSQASAHAGWPTGTSFGWGWVVQKELSSMATRHAGERTVLDGMTTCRRVAASPEVGEGRSAGDEMAARGVVWGRPASAQGACGGRRRRTELVMGASRYG